MLNLKHLFLVLVLAGPLTATDLKYKEAFLAKIASQVPSVLKHFDPQTGRFGRGVWIVTDQNVMLPLAVVYATPGTPYYKSEELLSVLIKAGDALIADADENGLWVFRKKDGSTWGKIAMPWTYSRWVRTYALIREDMPAEARERWVKALTLGYEGIRKRDLKHVHNIPAHHAMGLYAAGKELERPDWCKQAGDFLLKVVAAQAEGGYWSEGQGPVVNYNFVYIDALGSYYAMSGDDRVLPAIEKAIAFHSHFTYPGGQSVETIDQRNPFAVTIWPGNPGFTLTPAGRLWLHRQWAHAEFAALPLDALALFVLHGQEGPMAQPATRGSEELFVLTEGGVDCAATLRKAPWFVCLSAYTAPIAQNRWIQDRQNLVSIWHDAVGLIAGGGNTHLQPAWSTFTVGDMSLLRHTPGDESPDFRPKGELYHVPKAAKLIREPALGLDLSYGPQTCRVRIRVKDDRVLECHFEAPDPGKLPVAAHLTLMPHLDKPLWTGNGQELKLTGEPLELSPGQLHGSLAHAGWTLRLPAVASVHWPALPHNPYRKDGRAQTEEGLIEVRVPLTGEQPHQTLTLEVAPPGPSQ
ncbi:MAG TPA: hypothetical protein PKG54_05925 [Phycisphaerae bacterium]|nr:hypothetical protein [Phycisphaerae bacterium]HOJ53821.1 hypothetical protein [Phycisphaerae bacterium]HOL26152.1 hypothetical protein [Phycisphaerae bacterium]HPP20139.1 hypothetical protein [Phycisphaerae bacterium]HPU34051.1 hypothetical protein [Phycisphaerae bacterium]